MFLDYYKLREQPFGVTPDPRYLYQSRTHREAMASLFCGVTGGRGFMAVIARPGMGKTTLLFQLSQRIDSTAKTVFLFQTHASPTDFLRSLMADLGIPDEDGDPVKIHSKLNQMLVREYRKGKRFVLIIDEAQNLDNSVLEVVRMLSNFENSAQKLIQIILSGQPQLARKLVSPEMVQLRQRLSMVARLKPFNHEETSLYIDHRLRTAGYDFQYPLFTPAATSVITRASGGIPRNINNICFNSLLLGRGLEQREITRQMVLDVLADLDLSSLEQEDSVDLADAGEESRNGHYPDDHLNDGRMHHHSDPERHHAERQHSERREGELRIMESLNDEHRDSNYQDGEHVGVAHISDLPRGVEIP
jgi:general secretion pathway protein A